MPNVAVRSSEGESLRTIRLDDAIFGVAPNVPVMHQVVTAQLAAARRGTQSTKTRAEVRGGGAKPWRQKGSGRARQGSSRSPQWRGGGVALGPKPRSYKQRTPKKMVQLALHCALSDRAGDGKVVVVDGWSFDAPKTKDAVATLRSLELEGKGRVLLVLARDDEDVYRSFRNLPDVQPILSSELNAYDVLCSDWVVFTRATLPGVSTDVADSAETVSAATPSESGEADDEGPDWDAVVRGDAE
ncbi:MAG: 50S ribosomal protein L4 [Acidimicrobiales bacterium]